MRHSTPVSATLAAQLSSWLRRQNQNEALVGSAPTNRDDAFVAGRPKETLVGRLPAACPKQLAVDPGHHISGRNSGSRRARAWVHGVDEGDVATRGVELDAGRAIKARPHVAVFLETFRAVGDGREPSWAYAYAG